MTQLTFRKCHEVDISCAKSGLQPPLVRRSMSYGYFLTRLYQTVALRHRLVWVCVGLIRDGDIT